MVESAADTGGAEPRALRQGLEWQGVVTRVCRCPSYTSSAATTLSRALSLLERCGDEVIEHAIQHGYESEAAKPWPPLC